MYGGVKVYVQVVWCQYVIVLQVVECGEELIGIVFGWIDDVVVQQYLWFFGFVCCWCFCYCVKEVFFVVVVFYDYCVCCCSGVVLVIVLCSVWCGEYVVLSLFGCFDFDVVEGILDQWI